MVLPCYPSAAGQRQPATSRDRFDLIAGDGVALAPHVDTLNGTGTRTVERAVLRASNSLIGDVEMPLARAVESALRRIAFPPLKPCGVCWGQFEPVALVERPDPLADHIIRRICLACLDREEAARDVADREALDLAAEHRDRADHRDACPSCRRWGREHGTAMRFCPHRRGNA